MEDRSIETDIGIRSTLQLVFSSETLRGEENCQPGEEIGKSEISQYHVVGCCVFIGHGGLFYTNISVQSCPETNTRLCINLVCPGRSVCDPSHKRLSLVLSSDQSTYRSHPLHRGLSNFYQIIILIIANLHLF